MPQMPDDKSPMVDLIDEAHACAVEKGWWDGTGRSDRLIDLLDPPEPLPHPDREQAERDFPVLLALIHSEVSEALEAYRKPVDGGRCPDCEGSGRYGPEIGFDLAICFVCDGAGRSGDKWGYVGEKGKPEGILSELADVVIRVFDVVGALGMGDRFVSILLAKMAYNRTRSYRHGGKRC